MEMGKAISIFLCLFRIIFFNLSLQIGFWLDLCYNKYNLKWIKKFWELRELFWKVFWSCSFQVHDHLAYWLATAYKSINNLTLVHFPPKHNIWPCALYKVLPTLKKFSDNAFQSCLWMGLYWCSCILLDTASIVCRTISKPVPSLLFHNQPITEHTPWN